MLQSARYRESVGIGAFSTVVDTTRDIVAKISFAQNYKSEAKLNMVMQRVR